jgi:ABC-type microcin C transport system duplicated ATPase subunit YejF
MTERPPAAVFVNALTKTDGQVEAVRSIDLEVHAGETFGFLGPNAQQGNRAAHPGRLVLRAADNEPADHG